MDKEIIKIWDDELRGVLGKNSEDKIQLFFDFLEMDKNHNESDEKLSKRLLDAMTLYANDELPVQQFVTQILIPEQFLKLITKYIDKQFYDTVEREKKMLAPLFSWVWKTTQTGQGGIGLKANSLEESKRYNQGEKEYWAITYWARNTGAHDILCLNRRDSADVAYSLLFVMIDSLWRNKKKLEAIITERDIETQFNKEHYLKQIIKDYEQDNMQKSYVEVNFIVDNVKKAEEDLIDEEISVTKIMSMFKDGNNFMQLVGEAGLGKSRLMNHLAYWDAKRGNVIPVYVELKELTDVRIKPLTIIAQKIGLEEDVCDELLKKTRVNLYLDGINEILCEDKGKFYLCGKIKELAEEYPMALVLVSDRENSGVGISTKTPTLKLCRLDSEMKLRFIDLNCKKEKAQQVRDIVSRYDETILTSPIMLKLLIQMIENDEFDDNIDATDPESAIYDCYVKGLIKRETEEKGEVRAKKIEYMLSYLAACGETSYEEEKTEGVLSCYKESSVIKAFRQCANVFGIEGIDMMEMAELVIQMGFLKKYENRDIITFSSYNLELYFYGYAIDKGIF